MIDMKTFQAMALSFPHTERVPHFERIDFKMTNQLVQLKFHFIMLAWNSPSWATRNYFIRPPDDFNQ